eukprot:1886328-Rhodomonas_salina.1
MHVRLREPPQQEIAEELAEEAEELLGPDGSKPLTLATMRSMHKTQRFLRELLWCFMLVRASFLALSSLAVRAVHRQRGLWGRVCPGWSAVSVSVSVSAAVSVSVSLSLPS